MNLSVATRAKETLFVETLNFTEKFGTALGAQICFSHSAASAQNRPPYSTPHRRLRSLEQGAIRSTLKPYLICRLVPPEPNIDCVPQKVVGRPCQICDLAKLASARPNERGKGPTASRTGSCEAAAYREAISRGLIDPVGAAER